MKTNYELNIKDAEPEQLVYYKRLMLKAINIPVKVRSKLRNNGNILTIGDLLETSSLELFEALEKDYVLYKETKDILKEYGIELFSHTSAEAKRIKNRYHHAPQLFSHNDIVRAKNKKSYNDDFNYLER